MNNDKIDFSPLDPSRNTEVWERTVLVLAARGASRAPPPVLADLLRWSRPVLATAAALAFLAWLPALLSPDAQLQEPDPVTMLAQWAARNEVPPTAELLRVLGGDHGR